MEKENLLALPSQNSHGKSIDERDRIVNGISAAEHLLRTTWTHEIDATQSIEGSRSTARSAASEFG